MNNPNIKKDVDFVLRVLDNPDNKEIHLPALTNLIKNFENNTKRFVILCPIFVFLVI